MEFRVFFCGFLIVVLVKEFFYLICGSDEFRGFEKFFEIGLIGLYVFCGIFYKFVFVYDVSFYLGKVLLICGII